MGRKSQQDFNFQHRGIRVFIRKVYKLTIADFCWITAMVASRSYKIMEKNRTQQTFDYLIGASDVEPILDALQDLPQVPLPQILARNEKCGRCQITVEPQDIFLRDDDGLPYHKECAYTDREEARDYFETLKI